ncbi:hypothetical protein [Niabella soli]|uniref:Peptide chain release factor 1 n=1 Tax=Niabella soli DSM 19437 TaxID=929713 RepID=W0ETH8_9BACT|nr:hypothetical protein [Niabella soli]AHF14120.1 peptide chain release factor 1 [Niabella soli DSM 19437]
MEILDQLISEGESLTGTIAYVPAPPNVIRGYSLYRTSESDRYQDWLSSVQRFVKTYHSSDVEDVKEAAKKLSSDNHRKILGILRAIKMLPTEPVSTNINKPSPINSIHITNTQNNTQQVTVNLFLDAIKDELTGKEFKEIKDILKDFEAEPEKTKTKLIEKIKGFGGNVLSNIVANILTNPTIYNGLF